MYDFARDLASLGIQKGDTLLMHSSMKALGTDASPQEFLTCIIQYLGPEGTLLLPALSYSSVDAEHPLFRISETEPCIGLLPRVFFRMPGVKRSLHPTHSCCAFGRLAAEMTRDHDLDTTPAGPHSPFRRLAEVGGKILMVGPINDHCTFMHSVEEMAGVPYCLQEKPTRYILEDEQGNRKTVYMRAHDFSLVAHQRYSRFELLLDAPSLLRGQISRAPCTLLDAKALQEASLAKLREDPWFFVDRKE